MAVQGSTGPIIARHGPDTHGPGNISVAQVQRDRLGERGTGLAEIKRRVLICPTTSNDWTMTTTIGHGARD
ncbi:MAG: hypothetical protein U5K38_03250 [Woeseiaceae bacterium]|nr:hypothetical protein [Woeseiaceae bacterium]